VRQRTVRASRAVNAGVKIVADQARHLGAQDAGRGRIYEGDGAGEIEAEDSFARRVENGLIALDRGTELLGARENLPFEVALVRLQRLVARADLYQHGVEALLHGGELVAVVIGSLGHPDCEVFVLPDT